jgi:galactokinase
MSPTLEQRARAAAIDAFGESPEVVAQAPARVELLGNHTDHNGGLVLAAAIDRYTVVVGRASEGRQAAVRSTNLGGVEAFAIDDLTPGEPGAWGQYVRGVTWALGEIHGPLRSGFEAAIAGNVPLGAGLSSSASLQAAVAMFLIAAGVVPDLTPGLDDPARMALAKTLRRSENAFVGVASGLLDQFSSLFGRAGHALTLDCRSLAYDRLPLGDPAPAIVVVDSATSRRLADGMYNVRRAECEAVVTHFRERKGANVVQTLRDITLDELLADWDTLEDAPRRRARHVLTENDRVARGAEALRSGDVAGFGRLMSASHASSRDDFQNSSPALDALIESAESSPGFLGGKLSGAGWAGCTVNLVRHDLADEFAAAIVQTYIKRTGLTPVVHICHAADGASGRRLDQPV